MHVQGILEGSLCFRSYLQPLSVALDSYFLQQHNIQRFPFPYFLRSEPVNCLLNLSQPPTSQAFTTEG